MATPIKENPSAANGPSDGPLDFDFNNLTLSSVTKNEVNDKTSYRQFIRYKGGKLMLLTPNFEATEIVSRHDVEKDSLSLMIPIAPWLRLQLDRIEDFVQKNVNIPSSCRVENSVLMYKPLWAQDNMFISVSRWCKLYVLNRETGAYDIVDIKDTKLGPGTFAVSIEAPYVYIGPHKQGETYSLTLRIVQIVYQPMLSKIPVTDNPPPPPPPSSSSSSEDPKAVKPKGRKKKKTDEPFAELLSAMETN